MTYEEQQQYNSLSDKAREEYDWQKQRNPSWTHKQIMTRFAVDEQIKKLFNDGIINVDPTDPTLLSEILEGAKNFLKDAGIFIAEVFTAIDNALDVLGDLIVSGISYVGDKLQEFWDWLWN